jgi:Uma2 family endonuclease
VSPPGSFYFASLKEVAEHEGTGYLALWITTFLSVRDKRNNCMSATTHSVMPVPEQSVVVPTDVIWRFSVDQYHAMIRAGILTEDDPVELLEGWLITKIFKNPRHSVVTQLIHEAFARVLPSGWYVDTQEPITTMDSEPEPDVMIVRGETRQYLDRHPGPQEVALVVEVADSSLQRDRSLKKRLYAAAGIPVYWIINLLDSQIEVYTEPSGPAERPDYYQQHNYSATDTVPVMIEDREIGHLAVQDLLP